MNINKQTRYLFSFSTLKNCDFKPLYSTGIYTEQIRVQLFRRKRRRKGNGQKPNQSHSTSCPQYQAGKEHVRLRQHKIKTVLAENQEDSSFPADGQTAIINKMNNLSKTNTKRTNIDNKNKPQQKHRLGTVSITRIVEMPV